MTNTLTFFSFIYFTYFLFCPSVWHPAFSLSLPFSSSSTPLSFAAFLLAYFFTSFILLFLPQEYFSNILFHFVMSLFLSAAESLTVSVQQLIHIMMVCTCLPKVPLILGALRWIITWQRDINLFLKEGKKKRKNVHFHVVLTKVQKVF